MNKNIIDRLVQEREDQIEGLTYRGRNIARLARVQAIFLTLPDVSDTVDINPYGSSIWVEVHNREDLITFLTLSQLWAKETKGDYIEYKATIDTDIDIYVHAYEAALPDTCKLVEETYTVPAQPERTATRMVVKCTPPSTDASNEIQPSV